MTHPAAATRPKLGRKPNHLVSIPLSTAFDLYVHGGSDKPLAESTRRAKYGVGVILGEVFGEDRPVWQLTSAILSATLISARDGHTAIERAHWLTVDKRRVRNGIGPGIGNVRSTLKQFVKFCQDRNYLDRGVIMPDAVTQARKEDPAMTEAESLPVAVFDPKQWPLILDVAESVSPRTRIGVALMLMMGRRISDVVRLRWRDIDWQRGTINFYNVKLGRRIVELPLSPVRDELIRWRDFLTEHFEAPSEDQPVIPMKVRTMDIRGAGARVKYQRQPHLWPLLLDVPASTNSLRDDVTRVFERFGLTPAVRSERRIGPHTFRRSRGTQVSAEHGIAAAQGLLDHMNPLTTRMAYEKGIDAKRATWAALAPDAPLPDPAWMELPTPINVASMTRTRSVRPHAARTGTNG